MAPSNGSVKSRRSGSGKLPVKPVVPALPLPYVKRQPPAPSAAASSPSAPVDGHVDGPGAAQERATGAPRHSPASGAKLESASNLSDGLRSSASSATDAELNGHEPRLAPHIVEDSDTAPVEQKQALDPAIDKAGARVPSQAADDSIQRLYPVRLPETLVTANGMADKNESKQKLAETHAAMAPKSRPPPVVSTTHYQMPLPFHPTNRPPAVMGNGEMARGPRPHPQNGPHILHQAHTSNGSIHFGTFHDSQSSSPAPPHSGGIAPPPGMAGPDGRPPYMGPAGNGFPPMVPYAGDVMQAANFDTYPRPAMGFGHIDSYPPYGTSYGPSTPHSFHDSQSSAPPEDNGMFGPFPPGAPRSGGALPGDDMHAQNSQRRMFGPPEYPRMLPGLRPPPLMPHGDHGDGIVGYLQQQFASPETADCALELRYLDEKARPVRIPAHRLILCRSVELSALLNKKALEPQAPDGALQTLVLQSDGKWMQSDAFYMAVQRLYGMPLLPMPPHNRAELGDVMEARPAPEQLEFALAYAAAGCLLGWAPVTRRGCEVATQLLGWPTMEKEVEFALDGYRDMGAYESFKFGEGARVILNAVAGYIVHHLSPNFSLDTAAEELENYARLPVRPPSPLAAAPAPAAPRASSPTIAKGSSVQLGKGRRPQQIANIQFGDLSVAEVRNGGESETPKAAQQAQPVSHMILSRVLLTLPFTFLKMILEIPGSGNANDWASREARSRVVKRAVEEREARRLRIVEAITSGQVTVPEVIRTGLRSPAPADVGRWSVLGWQEEMVYANAEGPSLVRKWIPLMDSLNGSTAEYP
ncbi:hypothetical protein CDD83_10211 [Cordyceps sp. RAO-2017]|nr:hypothetical protein CDD83_10211 [Cordyceps sp. RAO-2017]